jgi:putative membrane protein
MMKKDKYPVWLFWIYIAFWIILAIDPVERVDWFLENILPFIFVPLIAITYKKCRLSNASYTFLFLFMSLHAVGAHYTYSQTPFLSEFMGQKLERDHFDRVAHFSFGFLLVYPVREFLIKLSGIRSIWSYAFPLSAIVAMSALYELMEWGVASMIAPHHADAWLGIQGDEWDAHKDMLLATIGAFITLTFSYFKSNKKRK